jgi:hypothetical protein
MTGPGFPRWYRAAEITLGLATGAAALAFLSLPALVRLKVIRSSEPGSGFLWAYLVLWGAFHLWLAVQFLRSRLRAALVRARADLLAGGLVLLSAGGLWSSGAPLGLYLGVLIVLGLFLLLSGVRGIRPNRRAGPGGDPTDR